VRSRPTVLLDMTPRPPDPHAGMKPAQFKALQDFGLGESSPGRRDSHLFWAGHTYSVRRCSQRIVDLLDEWARDQKIEITHWTSLSDQAPPRAHPDAAQSKRGSQLRRLIRPRKLWGFVKVKVLRIPRKESDPPPE